MARIARCTLVVAVVLLSGTLGCVTARAPRAGAYWQYPHAHEPTMAQSSAEHFHKCGDVAERDARALVEDLDLLFMTDRPTRLTRWHTR